MTLDNGASQDGAGIYMTGDGTSSKLYLDNVTIKNSTATRNGGAIFINETNGPVTVTLFNTTITGNKAQTGGAIYTYGTRASIDIIDSTILYFIFYIDLRRIILRKINHIIIW